MKEVLGTLQSVENELSAGDLCAASIQQRCPCVLGTSLELCCGLWAPLLGIWLRDWDLMKLLFFAKRGQNDAPYLSCWV